jgi:hypothetical protein
MSESNATTNCALAKRLVTSEVSVSKVEDETKPEYRREELGRGVRGKYLARVSRGTNLVALDAQVAKAFPCSSGRATAPR